MNTTNIVPVIQYNTNFDEILDLNMDISSATLTVSRTIKQITTKI